MVSIQRHFHWQQSAGSQSFNHLYCCLFTAFSAYTIFYSLYWSIFHLSTSSSFIYCCYFSFQLQISVFPFDFSVSFLSVILKIKAFFFCLCFILINNRSKHYSLGNLIKFQCIQALSHGAFSFSLFFFLCFPLASFLPTFNQFPWLIIFQRS